MDATAQIDNIIAAHPDWRGALMSRLRRLVHEADPAIQEDWKRGTAVWTRGGLVRAVGVLATHVKGNFVQGAALEDQYELFNTGRAAKRGR